MRMLYALACAGLIFTPLTIAVAGHSANHEPPQSVSPICGVSTPDGQRKLELIAPAPEAEPLDKPCAAASMIVRAADNAPSELTQAGAADETPYLAENAAAMDKMMTGMDVKATGNIDADFTAMMIPHHQGAIDMAVAYLRYGTNEQLRRIAQEIVVEQQQEIAAMRLALGREPPKPAPAPTQPGPLPRALAHMSGMEHHTSMKMKD